MKKKLGLCLAIMISFTILLVGCQKQNQTEHSSNNSNELESPIQAMVDRSGISFKVPLKINRIISMQPSVTQILLDMGLGDKIVAIDEYSLRVKGINEKLPKFDMLSPDTERIIELKPDVVFVSNISAEGGEDPFKVLTDYGISIVHIPTAKSLNDIEADITFMGDLLGSQKQAKEIVEHMEREITKTREISKTIKIKKRVYFEVGFDPYFYSFGKETFLDEIMTIIGAENIFSNQHDWVSISEETIVQENPDVILTNIDFIEDPVKEIMMRNGWGELKAVKNNQVFLIDNQSSTLPNHHVIKAMKEMAKAIYPEYY